MLFRGRAADSVSLELMVELGSSRCALGFDGPAVAVMSASDPEPSDSAYTILRFARRPPWVVSRGTNDYRQTAELTLMGGDPSIGTS